MDSETNIQELKDNIKKFCEDRNWDQYHNPKDLSIGIITEASELLEHFRFKSEEEAKAFFDNELKKNEISEELADILFFLLRLAQKYEIDLSTSFYKKLEKNEKNYPADKSMGSNKKYTELR
ncbi:MAG: nucleotide pyrophosphohydrolase [Candidatus Altiarchaeota archaeon]|nr:nucleotide pyrophosphohydrolase [Candidatus Altiarchaeota archaeon]